MTARPEDLFDSICRSIRSGSRTYRDEAAQAYELALTYVDGSPIELRVSGESVSDDGITLHRLIRDDRADDLRRWSLLDEFLALHHIRRDGWELSYRGTSPDHLIEYIQGLRDLEVVMPKTRERSIDFDFIVKEAVRRELAALVEEGRLTRDDREAMTNPHFPFVVLGPQPVTIEITADFRNKSGSELVVVLSHGESVFGERMKHVRNKLAEHALLRNSGNVKTVAVVPVEGHYGQEEVDHIIAFTGQEPLTVSEENAGRRIRDRLLRPDVDPFRRFS